MYAVHKNASRRVTEQLLERGALVGAANSDGATPLILVCRYGKNPEILELLLRYSADVTQKDAHGKRALDYARENRALIGTDPFRHLERVTGLRLTEAQRR
jgi:ankyrin repeat protein